MIIKRVKQFLHRKDVKANLVSAVIKRLKWRLHWLTSSRPFQTTLLENFKIYIPKSGSASLIYYQGLSEPDTAQFFMDFIKPGMVIFDIGAHIGEYTLLSAQATGETGQVHAFEPQESMFKVLEANVNGNNLTNVTVNCAAVSDRIGEIEFEVFDEPSVSSLRKQGVSSKDAKVIKVPTTSIDKYWEKNNHLVSLIKVDVEGAEKFVFEGATSLLDLAADQAPIWIFEYAPRAYQAFGYNKNDLLQLLEKYHYKVYQSCAHGRLQTFDSYTPASGIVNLVATKNSSLLANFLI
jgi:FkbM family methyltransferase